MVFEGHARVHPELAGPYEAQVTTWPGFVRLAAATYNDRQPGQLGMATQLDRCREMVEADVQHPVGAHRPHSLRARLSHASPNVARVFPRWLIWCST